MLSTLIKYATQIVATFIVLINISHAAGGIALGATRLIYNQDQKQASMPIVNSTKDKRYLINAWVEDASSKKIKSVIVTPPMFVSEAKSENSLRVVNADNALAKDRETLYFLNVQAIPSVNKNELEQNNVLQLAILSRIKMLSRPTNLSIPVENAPDLLEVYHFNQKISIKNPTPYFMTLVNVSVDGKQHANVMLDPFSEQVLQFSGNQVSLQTINDYGAFTEERKISVK